MKTFNRDDAIRGEFYTVNASNIISRIEKCELGIFNDKEKEAYDGIFRLRNKIVHFYHEAVNSPEANNLILISWRHIYKRLTVEWADIFSQDQLSKIEEINNELSWIEEYAKIVFKEKKCFIEKEKENGTTVKRCEMCSQISYMMDKVEAQDKLFRYVDFKCCVCGYTSDELMFMCQCGENIKIDYEKELMKCPYCKTNIKHSDALCCAEHGTNTIYENGDFFICTKCWSKREIDDEVSKCPDCDKYFFSSEMEEFDNTKYCWKCFEKNYENIDNKLRTIKKLESMISSIKES